MSDKHLGAVETARHTKDEHCFVGKTEDVYTKIPLCPACEKTIERQKEISDVRAKPQE